MNSEIAYWTLSTIAIVTVTLIGLLLVALVFFVENSIRQSRQTGEVPRGKPIGMIIISAVMFLLGVWNAYSAVSVIHDLPMPSAELGEDLSSQVDSALIDFRALLIIVGLYAVFFILSGSWELAALMKTERKANGEKKESEGMKAGAEPARKEQTRAGSVMSGTPSRRKKDWLTYVTWLWFVGVVALFGLIGSGHSGISLEQFRWKTGLYLQISLTVIALLVVFSSQLRVRATEDLDTARRHLQKGKEVAILSYMIAGIPLLVDSIVARAKRKNSDQQALGEFEKEIAEFKREMESKPGYSTATRLMKRFLSDENLWSSLRWCFVVFIMLASVSTLLVVGLEAMSLESVVTDSFYLGALGTLNGIMIVGITSLATLVFQALSSLKNFNAFQTAIEEYADGLLLERQAGGLLGVNNPASEEKSPEKNHTQ